jgi:predicted oxidoreductase
LGTNQIDLYQLHWVDEKVPLLESIGALVDLQSEGKIAHIGLSNVSMAELEAARPVPQLQGVTETEVSVVTLAQLTLGVLMADDVARPRRVATLSAVESTWDPLPVDAEVARQFAHIVAACGGKVGVSRCWTHWWPRQPWLNRFPS